MKPIYYQGRVDNVCRSALARGPLVAHRTASGLAWKFGRRIFSTVTVARLIAAGEAIRDGNIVRAA